MSPPTVTRQGLGAREPQTWQLVLIHSVFFFFLMDLESVLILTILFIYLFLAGLGLHGCMGLSLVAESWKHPPAAAYRLLTAAASLTVGHEL